MPAPVDLIRRVELFADVKEKELKKIAASFKESSFAAGEEIATEGEGGVGFFVIADGEATVSVGGEEVDRLTVGDSFGEVALIDSGTRTATVTAVTDLRCYGMTAWEFRPLVEENAEIAWPLLQSMAKLLRATAERGS